MKGPTPAKSRSPVTQIGVRPGDLGLRAPAQVSGLARGLERLEALGELGCLIQRQQQEVTAERSCAGGQVTHELDHRVLGAFGVAPIEECRAGESALLAGLLLADALAQIAAAIPEPGAGADPASRLEHVVVGPAVDRRVPEGALAPVTLVESLLE